MLTSGCSSGGRLWGCELVFRVPWHLFDKKLDLEMKYWEVVEGKEGRQGMGRWGIR